MKEINKFTARKAEIEMLEKVYNFLEKERESEGKRYEIIGKTDKQAKSWKTGELLWEDDEQTVPKYEDEYGYVDIPDDELEDDAIARIQAIKNLEKALEKLM